MYPTSPQRDEDEAPIDTADEANEQIEMTIKERGKFYYRYSEYILTWLAGCCCCCFIKKDSIWWKSKQFKYKRYEDAVEQLNNEIDILKHVSNQRISEFIAKLVLRKH